MDLSSPLTSSESSQRRTDSGTRRLVHKAMVKWNEQCRRRRRFWNKMIRSWHWWLIAQHLYTQHRQVLVNWSWDARSELGFLHWRKIFFPVAPQNRSTAQWQARKSTLSYQLRPASWNTTSTRTTTGRSSPRQTWRWKTMEETWSPGETMHGTTILPRADVTRHDPKEQTTSTTCP